MRLATLLAILTACSSPQLAPRPQPRAALPDIAAVSVMLGEPGAHYCAGVWISSRAILTAAHCLDLKTLTARVTTYSAGVIDTVAYCADFDADIAVLHSVSHESHDVARIRPTVPPHQTLVRTVGAPWGVPWQRTSGRYIGYSSELGSIVLLAHIYPGNSGGGLFDKNGLLIGVVVETSSDHTVGTAQAIPRMPSICR